MIHVVSPLVGTVIAVKVRVGDTVDAETEIIIIESMKVEHPVRAGVSAIVSELLVTVGDTVVDMQHLMAITPNPSIPDRCMSETVPNENASVQRDDLLGYQQRRQRTTDAARPDAVRKRHERGQPKPWPVEVSTPKR